MTTTNAARLYGFATLATGTYTVRVASEADRRQTGPGDGVLTSTLAGSAGVQALDFGSAVARDLKITAPLIFLP